MDTEMGRATELVGVGVATGPSDRGKWRGVFTIEKFNAPIEWYAALAARRIGTQDDERRVRAICSPSGSNDFSRLPALIQIEADRLLRQQYEPYDIGTFENSLLNTGINALWNIFFGNAAAANTGAAAAGANAVFNNAQARLAVGDSTTAFAASQTWLQAATNKYAQGMDATFPSVSAQTISFKSTITGTNADFAWQEFCADNANGSNSTSTTISGGSALNRAVSSQGTKAAGQSWALTLTVTLS